MAKYNLKTVLELEVIDKLLPVIVAGDKALEAKIAGMGTRVGSVDTWDARPTVDQNGANVTAGDTFVLTTADGNHPAGIYSRKPDNSDWNDTPDINFDELQISEIKEQILMTEDAFSIDDQGIFSFNENPRAKGLLASNVNTALRKANAFNAAERQKLADDIAGVIASIAALDSTYHPKGGSEDLTLLNEDAEENTKESVNASQLAITFTVDELQAKYDAIANGGTLEPLDTVHVSSTNSDGSNYYKVMLGTQEIIPVTATNNGAVSMDLRISTGDPANNINDRYKIIWYNDAEGTDETGGMDIENGAGGVTTYGSINEEDRNTFSVTADGTFYISD